MRQPALRLALSRVRAADPILWAIVTAVFAAYTAMSVARYATASPTTDDLGIFTQAVDGYAHFHAPIADLKGAGYDLLGDHFHPLLAALVPLFWVWPSPVTLLVAQAACSAVSVVPVYRAAVHYLPRLDARIIAAAYGLSWGLAGLNWYDFHEDALAVPLIAFALSALVRGRLVAAIWWSVPLVWVKEDQGLTVLGIGVVLAVVYGRRAIGSLLAAWGLGWTLLDVLVLIPALNPQHVYAYWGRGPAWAALDAGLNVKAGTLTLLLLPTAFLALRSPLALAAIPQVALNLLSSNNTYWTTLSYHFASVMPVLFVAAVDGLARVRRSRIDGRGRPLGLWLGQHGTAMIAIAALALPFHSPLLALWRPATYEATPGARAVMAAQRLIPPGVVVDATLRGDDRLAVRDDVLFWDKRRTPDYILFDQAPHTEYEWNVPVGVPESGFPGATYHVVFHRDHVWLLRRVG